jgi:DNA-directed RNA polymerase specialized sigma24 family protein
MITQTLQSEDTDKEKNMAISILPGPSVYDSDSNVDEVLEQYDAYIRGLVRKKVPRNIVPPEMFRDEIEELGQKVRIKLWHVLQKKRLANLKTYISLIVLSEVIDMVRRYHPILPLPIDEDGELYQGNVIAMPTDGMQDPAYEIEQAEALNDFIDEIFEALLELPPRQQYAMICALKDQLDDVLPLIARLRSYVVDIDEIHWPEEKDELHRLRVSLAVARKKLRSFCTRY